MLQARHLSPHDTLVMANVALVQQRLALKNLRAEGSRLPTVLGAVKSLEQAQRWEGHEGCGGRAGLARLLLQTNPVPTNWRIGLVSFVRS